MKNGWNIVNQNFNGGEVTPYLRYRTDLNQYKNSCKKLSNFLITPQGAIKRRGGTKAEVKFTEKDYIGIAFNRETRLIPFEFGDTEYCAFLLYHHTGKSIASGNTGDESTEGEDIEGESPENIREFEYGRVYARLIKFDESEIGRYEDVEDIETPFGDSVDLNKLRYIQNYNVIYFTHPDVMPCRLERYSSSRSWGFNRDIITLPPFKDSPSLSENRKCGLILDGYENEASCKEVFKGVCKIESNDEMGFGLDNYIGNTICIEYDTGNLIEGDWSVDDGDCVSKAVPVSEKLRFDAKGGIWSGTAKLELSEDGGKTWYTSGMITSINGSSNEYIERDIENPSTIARVRMTNRTETDDEDTGFKFVLTSGKTGRIYAKVLRSVDPTSGNNSANEIQILNYIPNFLHEDVEEKDLNFVALYESSWNAEDGYPTSVSVFEERLTFAGTKGEPHSIWLSETNNWHSFIRGTLATSPIKATLSCKSFEYITGMYAGQNLLILTNRGEYSFGARSSQSGVSGENLKAKKESDYGSANITPAPLEDTLMFVRCDEKRVANINYEYSKDAYVSDDMSILAEHMLSDGVKEIASQAIPYGTLWVLDTKGKVFTYTYMPKQEIMGWSRMQFGDGVLTMTSLRAKDVDLLVMLVQRGDKHTIESFNVLENETFVDAKLYEDDKEYYTYKSEVEPLPVIIKNGAYGEVVLIKGITLCLLNSKGGQVSVDGGKTFTPIERYAKSIYKSVNIDGEVEITTNSGYRNKVEVVIETNDNNPFTLCALGYYGNK